MAGEERREGEREESGGYIQKDALVFILHHFSEEITQKTGAKGLLRTHRGANTGPGAAGAHEKLLAAGLGALRTPLKGVERAGNPSGVAAPQNLCSWGVRAAVGTRRGTPKQLGDASQEHGASQILLRITGLIKWG